MSVKLYTYIGPMVVLQVALEPKTKILCKDPTNCPQPSSGFCPQCGISATDRSRTIVEEDPKIPFFGLELERMYFPLHQDEGAVRTYYGISNITLEGVILKGTSEDDEGAQFWEPNDLVKGIQGFEVQLAPELEYLRSQVPITIRWGSITYNY